MKDTTDKLTHLCKMLPLCGFRESTIGHFWKETIVFNLNNDREVRTMRILVQQDTVKVFLKQSEPGSEWTKIDGAYLKDVQVGPEGVRIGRKVFAVEE